MLRISLFLFLAVFTLACGTVDEPLPGPATVSGEITHQGSALADMQIAVLTADTGTLVAAGVSDRLGRFTIELPSDPANPEYLLVMGGRTAGGVFGSTPEQAVQSFVGADGNIDLGVFELAFYPLSPEPVEGSVSEPADDSWTPGMLEYPAMSEADSEAEPETNNQNGYGTRTGALGVGKGCLAIGCSVKCWAHIRWLVCGFSTCFSGVEIPLPYWGC